jgi:hypothetical protein
VVLGCCEMPPTPLPTLSDEFRGGNVAYCSPGGWTAAEILADVGAEQEVGGRDAAFGGIFKVLLGNFVVPSAVPESSLMQFHSLSAARDNVSCT